MLYYMPHCNLQGSLCTTGRCCCADTARCALPFSNHNCSLGGACAHLVVYRRPSDAMGALKRPARVRSARKRTTMALLTVFAALTFALLHAHGMGEATIAA